LLTSGVSILLQHADQAIVVRQGGRCKWKWQVTVEAIYYRTMYLLDGLGKVFYNVSRSWGKQRG